VLRKSRIGSTIIGGPKEIKGESFGMSPAIDGTTIKQNGKGGGGEGVYMIVKRF